MPTVSVVIPAHNQGRYLGEALRSVFAQTYQDFEVIVVDDGSTDDTAAVSASFADARLRYVYQDNRGLSSARNTGIRHARGAYLTFLDSDDLFLPEKLSLLLAAFASDPRLGLVAGQAIVIDEQGRRAGEILDRPIPADSSALLLGNPLHVGSVLLRRDWQERVGLFDETLRSYEDWDMWLRLARAGCPCGWVDRPVSLYRFHGAQMTRLGAQMTTATFAVLDHTYAAPDLPAAWLARRDEAYSRGFLRAAAQAYTAGDLSTARDCMHEAVQLNQSLCADAAEPVARLVAGWANHAKTPEPLGFLDRVYRNLPDDLDMLRRRRRRDLAQAALHLAFGSYEQQDVVAARSRLWQAVTHDPTVLFNRGVLGLLVHTIATRPRAGGTNAARPTQSAGPLAPSHDGSIR